MYSLNIEYILQNILFKLSLAAQVCFLIYSRYIIKGTTK